MTIAIEPKVAQVLDSLGIEPENPGAFAGEWIQTTGERIESLNPATGEALAAARMGTAEEYEKVAAVTIEAFREWQTWTAPKRGEIVRQLGDELRRHKEELGLLVSLEVGKILSEGRGEVQEMIDMADFAVGLSRQLYGLSMHSERPRHRMYEQWHPLGPIGIITAFNFPVAVWAWNAMVAAVCGDSMIWKPSHQTPLTAIADHPHRAARARSQLRAADLQHDPRRPHRRRRAAGGRPPPPADLRHRLGAAWASEVGKVVADRLGRVAPRARRQQRHPRDGRRRPRPRPARRPLRRRRHRRPALHHHPPPLPAARASPRR